MGGIPKKKALILNSRQSARPMGNDQWIINAGLAIKDAVSQGYLLLTSVGMNSWEIPLYFASKFGAGQIIYLPAERGAEHDRIIRFYMEQFHLNESLVEWRFIETDTAGQNSNNFQTKRDSIILHDAEVVFPISLRTGGNLDLLMAESQGEQLRIVDDFKVKYETARRPCKIKIDPIGIDRNIEELFDNYIIHWTKTRNTAWPGETLYIYYNDIVRSTDRYTRSGYDTLKRILNEKRLRGSSKRYRKGISAVAFSALKPSEAVGLMKWRARYQEMTFEPYGIAIEKSFAEKLGVKKVFYGNAEMYQYLEEDNRPYFQNIGTKGFWLPEKEYRHIGDVDLSLIPHDKMRVIVWKKEEISGVRDAFEGEIIPLYAPIGQ